MRLTHIYVPSSGVARTQPMPGHSVGTPCLLVASYPGPAQLLSRLRYGMQKQLGGSGDAPTENFGLHSSILRLRKAIPSHQLEHFDYAFATNLHARAQRKVTVVLRANRHTLRSGEHTRPRYSEGTDSNTVQLDFKHLCALLAPNSRLITVHSAPIIFRSACTGGAQPLVARARAPVCPSLATPLVPSVRLNHIYVPSVRPLTFAFRV